MRRLLGILWHWWRAPKAPPVSPALILAVVTLATYVPACRNEFVHYDDNRYVYANPHVKAGLTRESIRWAFTTTDMANWHPLTWLSFQLDYQLYGLNAEHPEQRATGYHATNIVLHALDAVLLYWLLRWLTGAVWRSFFVAAFFALHPLHVESVAWVSERKDVLSTLFALLCLMAYTWYARRPGVGRYVLVFLLLTLGLTAKSMLVTLPGLMLLFDYWPLGRVGRVAWYRLLAEKLPMFLPVAGSCALTVYGQRLAGGTGPPPPWPIRLETALISYAGYLGETFWPGGLYVFHPYPTALFPTRDIAFAAGLLLSVTVVVWMLRRRCPYLPVGWLWYLGTLLPVIGLVPVVGGHALADRYTYLPLIGLFVMLAWGAGDLGERFGVPAALPMRVGAVLLGLCAVLTQAQIGYWHDSATLWTHTLECDPGNCVAHLGLGVLDQNSGRVNEAIAHYQAALRTDPRYDLVRMNLGIIYWYRNQPEAAIKEWQQGIADNPTNSQCYLWLSYAYRQRGRNAEAIAICEQVLQYLPSSAPAHDYLGMAFAQAGRTDEAQAEYEEAVRLDPDLADAQANLADVLKERGRVAEAVRHYEQAVRFDPENSWLRVRTATALVQLGSYDEAARHCEEALRINPREAGAWYDLGIACTLRDRPAEAREDFQKAVDLQRGTACYVFALAHAIHERGDEQTATRLYREVLSRDRSWLTTANAWAWSLATHADAEGRNGALALWLALQLCEATEYRDGEYLDTLAAAYAEAGRFEEACDTAAKAERLLTGERAEEVKERLKLYREKRAFHAHQPDAPARE